MAAHTQLFVVDAFTREPFHGNPAGVVLLEGSRPAEWMQQVAAELRYPETAFVGTPGSDGTRELRWFTPTVEVDLCGHATLAAGHVLGGDNVFATRSGHLRTSTRDGGWIEMDFPADPCAGADSGAVPVAALGLPLGTRVHAIAAGRFDLLVEVGQAAGVTQARPDIATLADLPVRGVILTAAGESPYDIVSRCFYPAMGIPEDPVTGSAHCTLASWWCPKLGREEILTRQASPRGGTLRAALRGDRVGLSGQAVTVLSGQLLV